MGALSAVMQVASGFASAYATGKQAEGIRASENYNEKVENQNAALAEQQGRQDRIRARRQFLIEQGAGESAIAAGGSQSTSGSNMDWRSDFNQAGATDDAAIASAANREAWNHRSAAEIHDANASNAIKSARVNAYATMLSASAQSVKSFTPAQDTTDKTKASTGTDNVRYGPYKRNASVGWQAGGSGGYSAQFWGHGSAFAARK